MRHTNFLAKPFVRSCRQEEKMLLNVEKRRKRRKKKNQQKRRSPSDIFQKETYGRRVDKVRRFSKRHFSFLRRQRRRRPIDNNERTSTFNATSGVYYCVKTFDRHSRRLVFTRAFLKLKAPSRNDRKLTRNARKRNNIYKTIHHLPAAVNDEAF